MPIRKDIENWAYVIVVPRRYLNGGYAGNTTRWGRKKNIDRGLSLGGPIRRHQMGTVDKQGVVTMQELLVSSLATADALAKLLIEKGLITQAEFMQKLSAERAGYQAMLGKVG